MNFGWTGLMWKHVLPHANRKSSTGVPLFPIKHFVAFWFFRQRVRKKGWYDTWTTSSFFKHAYICLFIFISYNIIGTCIIHWNKWCEKKKLEKRDQQFADSQFNAQCIQAVHRSVITSFTCIFRGVLKLNKGYFMFAEKKWDFTQILFEMDTRHWTQISCYSNSSCDWTAKARSFLNCWNPTSLWMNYIAGAIRIVVLRLSKSFIAANPSWICNVKQKVFHSIRKIISQNSHHTAIYFTIEAK